MNKYYSLDRVLKTNAHYYVLFGERSNGKTYAVLEYALKRYFEHDEQCAIIRRWEDDFVGPTSARTCFDSLVHNGNGENMVRKLSNNAYDGITYYGGKWYLTVTENEKVIMTDKCVAYAFALNSMEHYKSGSYPNITTILFDEFITRKLYLRDEFVVFQNMISTIVRRRDNVKIFMCGNTVNKYGNIYFNEMGLTRVKDMRQGTIDVYAYGNSTLRVAVEFTDSPTKTKPSDVYFAFENPRLDMIKGTGAVWEMDIYPHAPAKIAPKDIIFVFFIEYDSQLLQCEIISQNGNNYLYIHRKTTPLKDREHDLIYSDTISERPNIRYNLLKAVDDIDKNILYFFKADKVFYADNEIGEIVNSYINFCKTKR